MSRPRCSKCDFPMIHISRPLMPIFGDIRAFQCQPCGYLVLLQLPFEPSSTIEVKANGAA